MRAIRHALVTSLLGGQDPLLSANMSRRDMHYPNNNQKPFLVSAVLAAQAEADGRAVDFYLELGVMLGNSLIKAVRAARQLGIRNGISFVGIDPFTGDVNMWEWENRTNRPWSKFRFLALQDGQPTIYERCLANIVSAGMADEVRHRDRALVPQGCLGTTRGVPRGRIHPRPLAPFPLPPSPPSQPDTADTPDTQQCANTRPRCSSCASPQSSLCDSSSASLHKSASDICRRQNTSRLPVINAVCAPASHPCLCRPMCMSMLERVASPGCCQLSRSAGDLPRLCA